MARPTYTVIVKEIILALGGRLRIKDFLKYANEKYPGEIHEGSLSDHLYAMSVNSPSRLQYPENKKVRDYNERLDILYKDENERGVFELYDPTKHGKWTIMLDHNGKTVLAKDGIPISDSSVETLSFGKLKDILTNIKLPRNYLPTTIRFLLKNYPNNCTWKKISEEIERLNSVYQDTQTGRVNTAKEMVVEQQSWKNFVGIRCLDEKGELTKIVSKATTCYLDVSDISEDQVKELIEICGKKIAQIHIRMREEGLV